MKKKNSLLQYFICMIMYILIALSVVSLLFQSFIGYKLYSQSVVNSGINSENRLNFLDLIPVATDAISGQTIKLDGQDQNRTNFLLLGVDPEAGLTDTIMILSYFHDSNKVTTINIPRDFYISTPEISGEKINGITTVIERYTNQDGLEYLKEFLEDEFLIEFHYYASINIDGLADVVDLIGGIEVEVKCTFTDYSYPSEDFSGFLRPAPTFTKGIEQLDGERAVIYSRSRKSLDCNEGTDFARNRRQSEVISAIINKVNSSNLIENSLKINQYLNIISDNLDTDMNLQEIYSLTSKLKGMNTSTDFISFNLSTSTEYICETTSNSGAYIITYGQQGNCGIYIAGSKVSNIYKTKLRNLINNLDQYSEEPQGEDLLVLQN